MNEISGSSDREMKFPCKYPIKVLSNFDFALDQFVANVISRHIPEMKAVEMLRYKSSKGEYKGVTVIIDAKSLSQIDAIYRDLTANKNITLDL